MLGIFSRRRAPSFDEAFSMVMQGVEQTVDAVLDAMPHDRMIDAAELRRAEEGTFELVMDVARGVWSKDQSGATAEFMEAALRAKLREVVANRMRRRVPLSHLADEGCA